MWADCFRGTQFSILTSRHSTSSVFSPFPADCKFEVPINGDLCATCIVTNCSGVYDLAGLVLVGFDAIDSVLHWDALVARKCNDGWDHANFHSADGTAEVVRVACFDTDQQNAKTMLRLMGGHHANYRFYSLKVVLVALVGHVDFYYSISEV